MNEIDFRNWLIKNGKKSKIASDTISRLKKIEKDIDYCDIDEQYRKDKCKYLLSLFQKMGENDCMRKYLLQRFPIGKYSMNTYRHAINQYIKFLDSTTVSDNL